MGKKFTVALTKRQIRRPRFFKFFLILSVFIGFAFLFLGPEYKKLVEKFKPLSHVPEDTLSTYDLKIIRDKKVINPRYIGVDDQKRPYVIVAKCGEHDENNLVKLDHVDAALQLEDGENLNISATRGEFTNLEAESKIQLSGGVALTHDGGYHASTNSADIDLATNVVHSRHPTQGSTPYGTWNSQGFSIDSKKKKISLKGKSYIVFEEEKEGNN